MHHMSKSGDDWNIFVTESKYLLFKDEDIQKNGFVKHALEIYLELAKEEFPPSYSGLLRIRWTNYEGIEKGDDWIKYEDELAVNFFTTHDLSNEFSYEVREMYEEDLMTCWDEMKLFFIDNTSEKMVLNQPHKEVW